MFAWRRTARLRAGSRSTSRRTSRRSGTPLRTIRRVRSPRGAAAV